VVIAMNDRELEVLRAAERIVGLLRRAQETNGSIPRETADLCLAAYDEAKKRAEDKTVFERVAEANEDPFADGIKEDLPPPPLPAIEQQNPLTTPIPEPESDLIFVAFLAWQQVLIRAKESLGPLRAKHGDPEKPPNDELAKAYKRVFRAQDVVHALDSAGHKAFIGHIATEGREFAWVMNFRVAKATTETPAMWTEDPSP